MENKSIFITIYTVVTVGNTFKSVCKTFKQIEYY